MRARGPNNTAKSASQTPAADPAVSARATRPADLVGLGFRGWMHGFQGTEVACWGRVWSAYAAALPAGLAGPAVQALAEWVRAVHMRSARRIEVAPLDCATFCRDECMAISIIAAAQNETCPAMRACAFTLLGSSDIDPVIAPATRFAGTLHAAGCTLTPDAIAPALSQASPDRETHSQASARH